jgi:predicted nucleotidyltransferase
MFEREIMIASLRRQRDLLKELVEELEEKSFLGPQDLSYCEEVMKKIESALRKLRRSDRAYSRILG